MSKEEPAMQGSATDHTGYVATHPLDPEDATITAALGTLSESQGALND